MAKGVRAPFAIHTEVKNMHVCSIIKNHIGDALALVQHNMSTIDESQDDRLLSQMIQYHGTSQGNATRALISLYASDALHLRQQDAVAAASIVETLHTASLIHDDIQDREPYRRGKPSLWHQFGEGPALCAGDFYLSKAYSHCADISQPIQTQRLIKLVHKCITQTISGQTSDITSTDIRTTSQDYETIAINKSGPLLGLALRIPLLLAGYDDDETQVWMKQCIEPFALSYQIVDDLFDTQIDAEQGTLNLVNLLMKEMSSQEASVYAKSRVELLLSQARANLALVPNCAGIYIDYCIDQLQLKVQQVKI